MGFTSCQFLASFGDRGQYGRPGFAGLQRCQFVNSCGLGHCDSLGGREPRRLFNAVSGTGSISTLIRVVWYHLTIHNGYGVAGGHFC
jgi:hypothetical protein